MFFAMGMSAVPAAASVGPASAPACAPGQPTPASYTWNFKGEAKTIFEGIQSDARKAAERADTLQSFNRGFPVDWQSHLYELSQLSAAINDMGAKLCRLEAIRRAVSPEQQRMIDLISAEGRLMAYHAQDAYNFAAAHYEELWQPTYRSDVTNLYNEAGALERSVGNGTRVSS
jgi:hypothetical protein